MKTTLSSTSDLVPTQVTQRIQIRARSLVLRVSAILVLIGLLAGGLYWSSAASASKNTSPNPKATVARDEITAPLAIAELSGSLSSRGGNYAPLLTLPQAPPPITVTTYAGDCANPKSVFNLQASEFSVCAKVTGFQPGWVIIWSNARFVDVQNVPVGTGESTFTLGPSSSLGDWRVILYEPFGGSVYALTPFTVVDAGNPSADLTISKTAVDNSVAAGSQALFTVQVTNLGPSDAATVQVSDSMPANTTFSSFSQLSGPEFICTTPEVGSSTGDSICTIASLARGESAVFVAAYDVLTGLSAGTVISNTASVSSSTADPSDANNSSTANQVVSGATAETCTLDCPANVVVTADTTSGGQPGAFVTFGAASVDGNCGAVTNTPASGSFFTVGTHSITSTSELGGASCAFTVTVLDTAAPTITCPPDITVTAAAGETEANVIVGNPTTSGDGTVTGVRSDDTPATYDENGNVITPAVVHALTDPYPLGTTGILWTYTDAGGRTASCTQRITVFTAGNRPPVTISCPANVVVSAPSGTCQATIPLATIGTPTTNPSDSRVLVASDRNDGLELTDPFPVGTTHITWTATDTVVDSAGNIVVVSVATCVQNVTVNSSGGNDTTPPTLTVPPNVSATTSSCTATLDDELGVATATDNCTSIVTINRTGVPANFVFPTGTTTIIYTATDAAGNTATGLQLVTVTESPAVPPTITAPADVSANTGPGATICGTLVTDATLGTASASDNCPGVTVVRTGVPAGNIFPVGNTTVTYTATDASGNMASDKQTVTVVDNTVPIVMAPGPVTLFTGPGATSCGVTVSNLDATLGTGSATDNCPGVGAVSRTGVPSGSFFPVGTTTLTYSATDAHGNTASATQTVTVVDNTVPVFTSCPSNITLEPTCPTGAIATYATPTATDNCAVQSVARTAGQASGTVFPIGTTTVTHVATDIYGNQSIACTFTVTVKTAAQTVQDMITAVNALQPPLTGQQVQGLQSKLQAALDAINQGKTNVACNKLADFINQVSGYINNGTLTSAQGQPLINSANHVRNTIGCTNLPCS